VPSASRNRSVTIAKGSSAKWGGQIAVSKGEGGVLNSAGDRSALETHEDSVPSVAVFCISLVAWSPRRFKQIGGPR